MPQLGTKQRPLMLRVRSEETLQYVDRTCHELGVHYMAELVTDQPEDLTELEQMLDPSKRPAPPQPARRASNVGRNDPCPCGSGLKFKKCCSGKPAAPP